MLSVWNGNGSQKTFIKGSLHKIKVLNTIKLNVSKNSLNERKKLSFQKTIKIFKWLHYFEIF